LKLERAP